MNKTPSPQLDIETYLQRLSVLLEIDRNDLEVQQRGYQAASTTTPTPYHPPPYHPITGLGSVLIGADVDHLLIRVVRKHPDHVQVITAFQLVKFPGCCAFIISTGTYVMKEFQGKGVNNLTNLLRQEIARYHNFTSIICTDVDDNVPERKTLARNGWKDIYQVTNKRTGHKVNITVKEL